ncbi:MAG: endonuclease/exonuclease/phosphatase family protein [Clostridia bacterium]|nr:endonuclease/exonuclease/phosphatase family protein [Clostridia bacterium]
MKKLLMAMALPLLMVSCGGHGSAEPAQVKIISYNIRCLSSGDKGENAWDVRKEASVALILAEEPDVIGCQEPWSPQIEYLTERLPQYGHVEQGRDEGEREDGGEHLMIMWNSGKYELLDSGRYWLSETPDTISKGWDAAYRRITLWVRLREYASGREFYYFDTHLDHRGDTARFEGAKLNVRKAREIAGEDAPVFFSGDMNIAAGSKKESLLAPYEEWFESVRETAPQTDRRPTFTAFGKSSHPSIIDYIYYRNAEPVSYMTLDGEDYGVKYISDHYPVCGIFRIE